MSITEDSINLSVDLTGNYYNHWPFIKIYHNQKLLFDNCIENKQTLSFNLLCSDNNNYLKFVHYGKKFGEDNVWDSLSDGSAQCDIKIEDIKFENVSIGKNLMSQLNFITHWSEPQKQHDHEFLSQYSKFRSNGLMSFNGEITLEFEVPILSWLIVSKYKVPITDTAYFSNYSLRWHYDEDLQIIKQIKEIMNLD